MPETHAYTPSAPPPLHIRNTQGGNQLFFIDELSKLALERCDSARCAVRTMGDAATTYGYYCSGCSYDNRNLGSAAETLAVGDKYGEVCCGWWGGRRVSCRM